MYIMQIFVKTLNNYTMAFDVEPSDTVYNLKLKVQYRLETPPEYQRLIYTARQLQDDRTLDNYKIVRDSVIHVVGTFHGKE